MSTTIAIIGNVPERMEDIAWMRTQIKKLRTLNITLQTENMKLTTKLADQYMENDALRTENVDLGARCSELRMEKGDKDGPCSCGIRI